MKSLANAVFVLIFSIFALTFYPSASHSDVFLLCPAGDGHVTNPVVSVPDGITVVMAGLIKDETIKVVNKIPLLGSIPLLGHLFKSTESQKLKNELIVFLTPHITTGQATPMELEKLNRIETGEK